MAILFTKFAALARPLRLAMALGIACLTALPAAAIESKRPPAGGVVMPTPRSQASVYTAQPSAEKIDVKVTLHKTETIRVAYPFTEALVGNADVADVVPLTNRSIYIVGKKVGVTRLTLLDQEKQLLGIVDVEVTYDLAALRTQLRGISGIKVSSVNGKLLLSGVAVDSVTMQQALVLAEQIAPGDVTNAMRVAAPQQVLLEVRFIEADRTASRALGVNATVVGNRAAGLTGVESNSGTISTGSDGDFVNGLVNNLAGGLAGSAVPFGSMIGRVLAGGTQADIFVKALEERGLARRLAEPNLVALSGDTASFLAGGEFPFPVSADNDKVTVEFKKFGVGLAFTPTVLGDGQINLKIEPEVSELDPTNFIRISDKVEIPSLIVRRASTTIELRDGQSFAVAGLLQSSNIKNQRQLPWIGDVPVLGALLRSAAWQKKETDLIIIVTPRLIRPRIPGQKLVTPLDSHMSSNDKEFFLRGQQEIAVKPAAPFTGHIIDWSNEKAVSPGYKEYRK
jgi:pilus assembly protein CpaC